MTQIYTSDNSSSGFDATSVSSLPTGWTAIAGTWSAQTTNALSGHTHTLTNTTKIDKDMAIYTGNGTAADMEVTFAQTLASGTGTGGSRIPGIGAVLRSSIDGLNNYVIVATISTNVVLKLFKKIAGTFTLLSTTSGSGISVSPGTILLMRAQIIGTSIKAKLWTSLIQEPSTWLLSTTDGSVSSAGYGGAYSGQDTLTGNANTLSDFSVDSVNATTGFINTSPTNIITSGGNITVSGTYTGTAPSGINYNIDGGSYTGASSPTISGGSFSFSITSPSAGFHTIGVQDSITTTTTDSGIYWVSSSLQTISPNNAAIVYSPYNWNVASGASTTINAGAYFKTFFTGTALQLNFDVSTMGSPVSEFWWRIDYSQWAQASVAASVTLNIPSDTISNADIPYHFLEVIVKSTTETINRWNTGATGTAIKLTSIGISSGATVRAPTKLSNNLLIYGDSITEGVRTVGETAALDTDRNDAQQVWSYLLGQMLGCEVGVVGFGATGFTKTGSGSVPALTTSYNLLYSGTSRSFSPTPTLVIINDGTNDGAASASAITTAATTVISGLLAATPSTTKIVMLAPLPASVSSTILNAINAAVTNIASPRVFYVATTGVFSGTFGTDSLGLHPSGPNDQALIAPQVAALVAPYMPSGTNPNSWTYS